jgi:hypothetical protein
VPRLAKVRRVVIYIEQAHYDELLRDAKEKRMAVSEYIRDLIGVTIGMVHEFEKVKLAGKAAEDLVCDAYVHTLSDANLLGIKREDYPAKLSPVHTAASNWRTCMCNSCVKKRANLS